MAVHSLAWARHRGKDGETAPPPCPNSQRGKDSAPCGSYTLGCLCKHGVTCNMHMHMHVVVPCAACLELDTLNPGGFSCMV